MLMLNTTIDCNALNNKISKGLPNGLKILFTTMANPIATKPSMAEGHKASFVPHSIFFDFENDFADKSSSLSNMMGPIGEVQLSCQRLGLKLSDEIVVYDDFGNFCASRVWFMLISLGFTNVKTLQGGLPAWNKLGLPTHSNTMLPAQASDVELAPSKQYEFVDAKYILSRLEDSYQSAQILDARSYARFSGTEADPRPNTRSGHIPGSTCMHYSSLLIDGCFKSKDELFDIFKDKKIHLEEDIITSCGSGITACIIAQAAFSLGAPSIKVYDASWSEWGADNKLPVKTLIRD